MNTFGKYTLLDKIAQGGMAEVWLARQGGLEGFQKLVVIKKILSEFTKDKNFVKMFLDEARLAAVLNHPNIVQVYDLGNLNGDYFIAMEYIYGLPLDQMFRKSIKLKDPLPLQFAAMIVSQAALGLYHAHTKKDMFGSPMNLVHRDISPQNIMVSFEGISKIVDFGIAKAATRSSEETQAGKIKGKVSYMSPEQVKGQILDGRSDIFALGVVLYEITTGRKIFATDPGNTLQLINAIINEPIIPPIKIIPTYPKILSAIVMKALAKDRNKRYQSAVSLSKDLERFLKMFKNHTSSHELSLWMQKVFHEIISDTKIKYEALIREESSSFVDIKEYDEDNYEDQLEAVTQIFDLNEEKKKSKNQKRVKGRNRSKTQVKSKSKTQVKNKSKTQAKSKSKSQTRNKSSKRQNIKPKNKFDDFDDFDNIDDFESNNIFSANDSWEDDWETQTENPKKRKKSSKNSNKSSRRKSTMKESQRINKERVFDEQQEIIRKKRRNAKKKRELKKDQKKERGSVLGWLIKNIILFFVLYLIGLSVYVGYYYIEATDKVEKSMRNAYHQSEPKVVMTESIKHFCKQDKFIMTCDEQRIKMNGKKEFKFLLKFTLKTKFLWKWPISMQFSKLVKTRNYDSY